MLTKTAQKQVSEIGGGFAARSDIKASDANTKELQRIVKDVDVFRPDWEKVEKNLDSYIDAWRTATGS